MNKFNHKPNCRFIGFYNSLTRIDHNGPDSQLTINEDGIDYDHNIHPTTDKEDFTINFHYCPCCGIPKEGDEKSCSDCNTDMSSKDCLDCKDGSNYS